MTKWRVTVAYSSNGKNHSFSTTVWTEDKTEAIEIVVESIKASRPNVEIQLTHVIEAHVVKA